MSSQVDRERQMARAATEAESTTTKLESTTFPEQPWILRVPVTRSSHEEGERHITEAARMLESTTVPKQPSSQ